LKDENDDPANAIQNPPEIRSKGRPSSKRIDNAGLPNKRRRGGNLCRPFTEITVSDNVDNSNCNKELQRKRKCGLFGASGHYAPHCPEAK
jgi:hypothetical protein